MVFKNGPSDGLQQHRFSGPGSRNDQPTLAFADRGREIHHTGTIFFTVELKDQTLFRIERRQVIEEDFVARHFWIFIIDLLDLEQRKVPFALLRRPDLPGHNVAGAQIETPDLRGRDIDIVGTG